MDALPSLRFIAKPEFGIGVDARLRFGMGCNCFMAAESYVTGRSFVGFGLEPRRASWLRLQLVPTAKLIIKMPMLRLSEFKYSYMGAETTLYDRGSHPSPDLSSASAFWKSIKAFVRPAVEVQHHNTIMGTLLDSRQRRILKEALREVTSRRNSEVQRLQENRSRVMRTFDPPELPPLDPRRSVSELRKQIHERSKERKLRIKGTSPVLLDDLRDANEAKPEGKDRPDDSMESNSLYSPRGKSFVLASSG